MVSYGFPMVFPCVAKKIIQVAVQIQRRLWWLGRLHHLSRQSDSARVGGWNIRWFNGKKPWENHRKTIGKWDNKTGKSMKKPYFMGKSMVSAVSASDFPYQALPFHGMINQVKSIYSDYWWLLCYYMLLSVFFCKKRCEFKFGSSSNSSKDPIWPYLQSDKASAIWIGSPKLKIWSNPTKNRQEKADLDVYLPTKSVKKAMEIFHYLQ